MNENNEVHKLEFRNTDRAAIPLDIFVGGKENAPYEIGLDDLFKYSGCWVEEVDEKTKTLCFSSWDRMQEILKDFQNK